jgi:phage-related protein
LAELAPAIATVANLIVKFFADNASGWSMATTLANALGQAIRGVAGAVTFLYGAFQVLSSFLGVFITGALGAFSAVTEAIGNMLSAMADAAEALPGMDVGLSSGLRSAADSVSGLSTAAGDEAELWGQAAADNFADGVRNMSDPFAAFDAEFSSVTAKMQQAGAAAGAAAGQTIAGSIAPAIRASGAALQAMVVGTGEGEAFRNAIARGADPRQDGVKAAEETADNTGEMVDQLDELNSSLSSSGGFGLASISV